MRTKISIMSAMKEKWPFPANSMVMAHSEEHNLYCKQQKNLWQSQGSTEIMFVIDLELLNM